MMNHTSRRRTAPQADRILPILWLIASLLVSGCGAARSGAGAAPGLKAQYSITRERISLRRASTHTASYRIRWRVREIEPHAEMILRVDYKAPNRFHLAAKGPLDVPLFTAWVVDSIFVLIHHREGITESGHLRDLRLDEMPIDARPFGAFWELFAGGPGIALPDSFIAGDPRFLKTERKDFIVADLDGRSLVVDVGKSRVKELRWKNEDHENDWELEVQMGRFEDEYPFWELRSARWVNLEGPGEYRWEILAQRYNHELPDRLFVPPEE
jgi:hypothetical protein